MDREYEPPSGYVDIKSRYISAFSSLARRFKAGVEFLGNWGVCPVRSNVSGRCRVILKDF